MKEKITQRQSHIMRHSIGLSTARKPYRNYFAVEKSSPDYDTIHELVSLGMMKPGRKINNNEMQYFHVTDEGLAEIGFHPSDLNDD